MVGDNRQQSKKTSQSVMLVAANRMLNDVVAVKLSTIADKNAS